MKIEKLAKFIQSHGITVSIIDDKLHVIGIEVDTSLPVGHPDRIVEVPAILDPIIKDVKDWLGY